VIPLSLFNLWTRLVYPPRQPFGGPPDEAEEVRQVDGWVEAASREYFSTIDEEFVDRAIDLGVSSGMILDINSPLGLVPMKILWKREDFLAMGVYRTRTMADRTRETAVEWGLEERMFFQVGEPSRFRFKDGYFDMVLSDGVLHEWDDPEPVLREIRRITKPTGAVLVRDLLRPPRLLMSGHIRRNAEYYPPSLRETYERSVRSGFTTDEFLEFAKIVGDPTDAGRRTRDTDGGRTRVLADTTHVMLERRGSNDPESWVTERERYQ
jgi:SAM-dependent methyltransferase